MYYRHHSRHWLQSDLMLSFNDSFINPGILGFNTRWPLTSGNDENLDFMHIGWPLAHCGSHESCHCSGCVRWRGCSWVGRTPRPTRRCPAIERNVSISPGWPPFRTAGFGAGRSLYWWLHPPDRPLDLVKAHLFRISLKKASCTLTW